MMRSAVILCAIGILTTPLRAQDVGRDLRESQLRLDSIRQERARLQREMARLRSRVRDASREVANAAKQRAASASVVRELDLQTTLLGSQAAQTRAELDLTEQRLNQRLASFNDRLRSIYKRGPLHTVRVLLSAEDFSDLLNRYKYLHAITLHDRTVLEEMGQLQTQLTHKEVQLAHTLTQHKRLRGEKNQELNRFQQLESRRKRSLADVRRTETRTAQQLERTARAERGLATLIARIERERREKEARRRAAGGAAVEGSISTRDLGALNWPVSGQLIYRFGPSRKSSGVVLVNKGIGIAAPPGTPVRAVEAGTVSIARPLEGYGPTVMLNHGGGFYTLYMFLRSIAVREGQQIENGHVVGNVGGEQTPEGAHLFFQVRAPVQGDATEAVDPLVWLRSRGDGR